MQPWVTRAHFYKSLKPEVFIKNMKSQFFFTIIKQKLSRTKALKAVRHIKKINYILSKFTIKTT